MTREKLRYITIICLFIAVAALSIALGACRTLAKIHAISMFFDEKFLQFSQKIKLLAWIFIKVRQAPRAARYFAQVNSSSLKRYMSQWEI